MNKAFSVLANLASNYLVFLFQYIRLHDDIYFAVHCLPEEGYALSVFRYAFPSTKYLHLSLFSLRHISLHFQMLSEFLLVTCRHFRIKNSVATLWFFCYILTDVCNATHFCTFLECNLFVFSFSFGSLIKIII